ncbi:MAG: fumarylacetoacetate hydrolase [Bacilli bacterium]|nr:fumarylacetoacetate hydrolase [Bacilli bacterium]
MDLIRNVYCVGRNYRAHAEELGNAVPTSLMLFSKPTHAVVDSTASPIVLPANAGEVHYEVEVVLAAARTYEQGMTVEELVDEMSVGIDFTLRDVQTELKKKGHPWLAAKGFRNSALLTKFRKFPGTAACKQVDFSLRKNGQEVQRGNISDLIFDLQTIIEYTAAHFGLDAGDIIFTGTPQGVGPVFDGDTLSLYWGHELAGESVIRLI